MPLAEGGNGFVWPGRTALQEFSAVALRSHTVEKDGLEKFFAGFDVIDNTIDTNGGCFLIFRDNPWREQLLTQARSGKHLNIDYMGIKRF